MAGVPTTPTATDKLEEVRKLNIEIARLTSSRDVAAGAAKEAQEAADDARGRKEALDKALEALDGSMGDVAAGVREFVASCRGILQTVTEAMAEAAAQCRAIAAKVDILVAEIGGLEKTKQALLESISAEAELMSTKRADLDVYHERIKKAAAEHLPGQKVEIATTL